MFILLNTAAIVLGLALLTWSADRFVSGAAVLARNLGVSPMLIGLTVVGLGTSAPEILISGIAAAQGNPELGIGNAVGSNIANIGLILGVCAVIRPLSVRSTTLTREYPILLAVYLLALVLMLDMTLGRLDGALLVAALFVVMSWMVRIARRSRHPDPMIVEYETDLPPAMSTFVTLIWIVVGLAGLLISSRILVWGAVNIANELGVSNLIVGLTIIAIGTSLPELATSIASALKGKHDIAIGNIVGSNLYNLLAVLSLPGIISPGAFAQEILHRDMTLMIGLTIALFAMSYGFGNTGRINRLEGLLLLTTFIGYQGLLLYQVTIE